MVAKVESREEKKYESVGLLGHQTISFAFWMMERGGKAICLHLAFKDLTVLLHNAETKQSKKYAATVKKQRIDESFTLSVGLNFFLLRFFRLHTSFARAACLGT